MENTTIEQPDSTNTGAQVNENFETGSMIGKFKDAKSLLEAYNNLEAEFTRKSQKLAEFEKENKENAVFQQQETIDNFLKDSDSNEYKKSIMEILNDPEINNLPNKYQVALKIAKEVERKSAEQLNSQDFIDKQIQENENIKNKIILDYLSKLNNIQATPKTISGNSTNIYFSPNNEKPKTFKEAGELLSKMLK